jgi:predicted RNA-binding Zn-ribbon protein involved in translation (DUF1610 family)
MLMARRRVMPGADYRTAFEGTGDVFVGASGRAWLRRRILLALAGLALIGAAGALLVMLRPPDVVDPVRPHPVVVQCVACGARHIARVDETRTKFPLKCSNCGERACQKMWECRDCKLQFLPSGSGDRMACPHCGSERVGSAEELRPAAPPAETK